MTQHERRQVTLGLSLVSCCSGRGGKMRWWKSPFLDEEGGQTIANWNRGTHMEGEKEGDVCPHRPMRATGKGVGDKAPSDRCGRTGRSTHRQPLTELSCILTAASSNAAKAQMRVHRSENTPPHTHTHTETAEGEPLHLSPSLQRNLDSKSHPSALSPPSCCITDTLLCCSGKWTERKGFQ